ncbi:MAG: M23 family metallopeptidase [Kiritimatiellales bacterium]
MKIVIISLLGLFSAGTFAQDFSEDFLTPAYYSGTLKPQIDRFLEHARTVRFQHPLDIGNGKTPQYTTPKMGQFGAEKGRGRPVQYHPATDLHVGNRETEVSLYAAHNGVITTVRDAPKYRQYISITKEIRDAEGNILGKLVTLYGHVDLDLNEADGLQLNGKTVQQGDLISKHLYAGTVGGPHLHFEIRYYRPNDVGTEEFYGMAFPGRPTRFTEPSAGGWKYGLWDPDSGYGYGNPVHHGLKFY